MPSDNLPAVRVADPGGAIALAPEAWQLAGRIAGTDFVPRALRGKPEAVLACILTGHELGIGPMQALSKIHVVDGRPAAAAELMRALVLSAGHDIWVEESTSTRVRMGGRRAGSSRDSYATWTTDDARGAGLLGKDNWKRYPRAMLLARATAELCRAVFPDVLAGISYTVEELEDDPIPADGAAPPATAAAPAKAPARKARASRAATRTTPPPAPAGEVTVEDDPLLNDAPLGDVDGPRMSAPQLVAMRFADAGVTDRDERLEVTSRIVNRPVASSKELTNAEVTLVLEVLDDEERRAAFLYAEEVTDVDDGQADEEPVAQATDEEEAALEREESSSSPPAFDAPTDATGWRDLLKGRGVRVVEALRIAEVPSFDELVTDQAAAQRVLDWLEED
jgi:hypothetical protein